MNSEQVFDSHFLNYREEVNYMEGAGDIPDEEVFLKLILWDKG